jgi:hypothetical protein
MGGRMLDQSSERRLALWLRKQDQNLRAPDPVDPKHHAVEFENDRVRVLRIRYGPGEKSVIHEHPASVAVFLTDSHTRCTYPNGKTVELLITAGHVQHFDAFEHDPENLGGTPFEVIAVEMKG